MTHRDDLFLLEEQRRFLAQNWKKAFRCLREEPRQRHFDAQRILKNFDARRRSLPERAHLEAQGISFPGLLIDRDHPSEMTGGPAEAFFKTADGLGFSEPVADGDGESLAHSNWASEAKPCGRRIRQCRRSFFAIFSSLTHTRIPARYNGLNQRGRIMLVGER
jgi:hypothetical protein